MDIVDIIWLPQIVDKLAWKHHVSPEEVMAVLMHDDKQIPTFTNYEDMAAFWETHSLADYWDQTESATFAVTPEARRRYLVAVDREVLARVQRLAHMRGISSESLINLLLEQRLREVESQATNA